MFIETGYYKSFSAGHDLWALTFNPEDFWFKKINWHTQFLLNKINEPHQNIDRALLMPTEQILFNKSLLCLLDSEDIAPQIYQHWKNLKKPSLRIFLNSKIHKKDLESFWPLEDLKYSLSYVAYL